MRYVIIIIIILHETSKETKLTTVAKDRVTTIIHETSKGKRKKRDNCHKG